MDVDGTGNIVAALNRGWRHWNSDWQMVEPTFSVQVNYCKTSFFTVIYQKEFGFIYKLFICMYFCFTFFILLKKCWFKRRTGLFSCGNKTLFHSCFIIPEKPWVEWIIQYFTYVLQKGYTKGIETSCFAVGSQWAIFAYCFRHQYWKRSLRE